MNSHAEIKVALIVDSPELSEHDQDLVKWSKSHVGVAITHLIVQRLPEPVLSNSRLVRQWDVIRKSGLKGYLEGRLWRLIRSKENKILDHARNQGKPISNETEKVKCDIIEARPNISKSGHVYRYQDSDIEKIRAENFDVLIRCGSGILRGQILKVARFGIISFHHADNRINRGIPPCFWEVYYKQPKTGFIIQQLTDELDGGNVLKRGAFPTKPYWLLNLDSVYERSAYYLKKLLSDIADNNSIGPIEESVPYYNRLFKRPGLGVQAHYLLQTFMRRISTKLYFQILKKWQFWGIFFKVL